MEGRYGGDRGKGSCGEADKREGREGLGGKANNRIGNPIIRACMYRDMLPTCDT